MAKSNKVKKAPLENSTSRIHALKELPDNLIRFSFRHFDETSKKFTLDECNKNYFAALINRLKGLSEITVSEFKSPNSKGIRAHQIDWDKTSEPQGFRNLNKQLKECEPWQFAISANEHGRVHGLFIDEVFYIVWIDQKHQLYPSRE